MKTEWTRYFKSLDMSRVLARRATQAFEALSRIWQENITDVFVSEYINEDGIREFEHVFFFTPSHIIQCTRFALEDTFDADALHELRNLLIKRTDFDFDQAKETSRLHVRYNTTTGCGAELKASRENCVTLTRILRERLIPFLKPHAGSGLHK